MARFLRPTSRTKRLKLPRLILQTPQSCAMERKQTPILSKDGVDYYRVIPGQTSPQLAEAIATVVSGALLDEPLCRLLGITLDTIKLFIDAYLPECIESGLSTYATFAGQSTPVGAFICRDYKLPTPEAVKVCMKRGMTPILDVLTVIDTLFEKRLASLGRKPLKLGEGLDLFMTGVAPEARQRKISFRLAELSTALAKEAGYKRTILIAKSAFSASIAQKQGFDEMAALDYKDYRFEGEPIFAGSAAPHNRLLLFEKDLSTSSRL